MSAPTIYEIVVRGELGESFATMFDELSLERRGGETVILVDVIDSAQLHGVLERLRDLSLEIRSVNPVARPESDATERGTP